MSGDPGPAPGPDDWRARLVTSPEEMARIVRDARRIAVLGIKTEAQRAEVEAALAGVDHEAIAAQVEQALAAAQVEGLNAQALAAQVDAALENVDIAALHGQIAAMAPLSGTPAR